MATRTRRIALYLVAALVFTFALSAIALYLLYEVHVGKREAEVFDHTRAAAHAGAVAADLKLAATLPPLAAATRGERDRTPDADAGPYLNPRLRWQLPGDMPPPPAAFELPQALTEALESLRTPLTAEAAQLELDGVDFAWMRELSRFTYWSLESAGPLADAMSRQAALDPVGEPRPDLSLLGSWVKLRLVSVLRGAPLPEAASEITRLAQLAMSTERITLTLAGLSWLTLLEDAKDLLVARGQSLGDAAPRLDRGMLARVRRALWGQMAYLQPGVADELSATVFPGDAQPGPGLCAALNEQLPPLRLQRALLAPFYPGEMERVERLVARLIPHCRPSAAFRLWSDKAQTPAPLQGDLFATVDELGGVQRSDEGDGGSWQRIQAIPPLHKLVGLTLAAVARPEYLSAYTNEP